MGCSLTTRSSAGLKLVFCLGSKLPILTDKNRKEMRSARKSKRKTFYFFSKKVYNKEDLENLGA